MKSTRRVNIGLVLATIVAACLVFWLTRRHVESSDASLVSGTERTSTSGRGAKLASAPTNVEVVDTSSGRTRVNSFVIRGTIVDDAKAPVPDATVSWTPLLDAFNPPDWALIDWNALDKSSIVATSNSRGEFEICLSATTDVRQVSALWSTKANLCAASVVLTSLDQSIGALEIVMTRQKAASIRVLDGDARPVPRATVDMYGTVPWRVGQRGTLPERALRVLHRRAETNDDGVLQLSGPSTDAVLVARKDVRESREKVGPVVDSLTLVLSPTFRLSGQLRFGRDCAWTPDTRVMVELTTDQGPQPIGSIAVASDGSYGPGTWPIVESSNYAFCALGGDFLPSVVRHDQPKTGEDVVVDFDCVHTHSISVRAVDASREDQPLEGAAVEIYWGADVSSYDVMSGRYFTDASGVARIPAPSTGSVSAAAERKGFADTRAGPFTIRADDDNTFDIRMTPGGTIVGRVISGDAPVSAFRVAYWPGSLADFRYREFDGVADGNFRIEDVPIAQYQIYATSETQPRSEVATVHFNDGVAGPIVLALAKSFPGVGQVIDSDTRKPIPSATVEVWNSWQNQILTPQGSPVHVDVDGRFRVEGLREGRNMLWVKADGYPSLSPGANVDPQTGQADFGYIPMVRGAPVAFQLASDKPLDFSRFTLTAEIMLHMPPSFFASDGRMLLGEFAPGEIELGVGYPDNSTEWSRYVLRRATPTTIVHRVRDDVSLLLTVREAGGCSLPKSIDCSVASIVDGARWERQVSFDPGATLTLDDLPFGAAVLDLSTNGAPLLRKHVVLGPDRKQSLSVEVNCRSRVLRVVDPDGKPCAGCTIKYGCADERPRFDCAAETDENGCVTIPDPDCDRLIVSVYGQTPRYGIEVSLDPKIPAVQDVVLGPDATLRVRLLDGADALRGIWVWCEETNSGQALRSASTDSKGVAEWDGIREAKYRVVLDDQGLWHADAIVASTLDANTTHDVQVRRVGGVEFEVRGSLGEPLADATVELVSNEFATNISTWISDGRLAAPTQGLATDLNGKLTLDGLPHGDYAWTVQTADGKSMTGSVTIPIASRAAVLAVAP